MNILIVNHYAGSVDMGMEFRPYYLGREWLKAGHKVDIIAGDYSHLRKKNPIVERDFQKEDIEGLTYHWIKTGVYEGNGVKRALTMMRFVRKLWLHAKRIARELKPDVVISSSTYPIDTYASQKIAKYAHAKLIHEVHDLWPLTLIELGGMSKYNPFVMMMQMGENSAYKHSDFVVSLLPYAKEYMMKHGMREEKFRHITNGIVLEDWEHPEELPEEHRETIERYRREGKFIVGYFGGHALSNALDILVDAAKVLKEDKAVQFVLVGSGVEKEKLQERAKRERLENICFLPPVPKLSVPCLVDLFDCIYIGLMDSPLYRFGMALNKVYDSMMGGKPLLYALNAPNNYVRQYQCGIDVEPGNVEALVEGIYCLLKAADEEKARMGSNGKAAVIEHYNYKIIAEQFTELFTDKK
ncbi:MAG: glycosyltransferase family 4 protein [Candidatus Gastranaerophilales bacterium]|nr:glycosyltransferase family 4 protein [Candidatus Gastranaerophilales bacterium]